MLMSMFELPATVVPKVWLHRGWNLPQTGLARQHRGHKDQSWFTLAAGAGVQGPLHRYTLVAGLGQSNSKAQDKNT